MKMVMAIYNAAVDEEVMDAVRGAGVSCYTKWPRAVGQGQRTGPRLDNHIWPGANSVMIMVVPDEMAAGVMDALRGLRESVGRTEGVKAFMLNVEAQL